MSDSSGSADFGGLLRALREARSLTQEELAERARMSAKAVSALERGERRRPYPTTVRSLAEALDLDDSERRRLVAAVPQRGGASASSRPSPGGRSAGGPVTDGSADVVVPATPIVGRETEIAQVLELVGSGRSRLVTIVGPGGVGKTRLAVEVASRAAEAGLQGAVFVDVSPVRDPALVTTRIAAALGLPDRPVASMIDALVSFLAGRSLLIVLDNLEQVLDCALDVATLVTRCPDLVVLATSRAPLRVRAEREVLLSPLDVPAGGPSSASIAASPAAQLLVERCAAVGTTLDATERAGTIAAICARLDGLPLAIELAASATRLLSPEQVLDRLERGEVAGELRDLPDRQRTMSDVIDWSCALLDDRARTLFPRLAVFSGGFDLDAVAAVAPAGAAADAALGLLVDQALVERVPTAARAARLRLLEPVRQQAMRQLHRTGEATEVADLHAAHYGRVMISSVARQRGPDSIACFDELDADHANLRSALLRLVETGRADLAAEAVHASWLHLTLRGHSAETMTWICQLRARSLGPDAQIVLDLCEAALAYAAGDMARTARLAAAALPRAGATDRDDLVAEATTLGASAAIFSGDVASGLSMATRLDEIAERSGAPWDLAQAAIVRAQAALVGRDPSAGRITEAVLVIAEDSGNAFTVATALNLRATWLQAIGDLPGAAGAYGDSADLSLDGSISWTLVYALSGLATVAAELGDPHLSATLFGASAVLVADASVDAAFPTSRSRSSRVLDDVRRALGDEQLASAWRAGATADRQQLAALAQRVIDRAAG